MNKKDLDHEQLEQVSGGFLPPELMMFLASYIVTGAVSAWDKFMELIDGPEVTGPKTSLIKCPICGRPMLRDELKNHIITEHSEEIIKNSPIC